MKGKYKGLYLDILTTVKLVLIYCYHFGGNDLVFVDFSSSQEVFAQQYFKKGPRSLTCFYVTMK